ncbi:BnaAnng19310D [Brassica napus]|uniref:BnaAnng19310D protein n=1 Tax=Brassica napus TaxID=3708 RepID=A0A078JCV7_BRANA|nr:BnaAnng19310D [Brassica napus]
MGKFNTVDYACTCRCCPNFFILFTNFKKSCCNGLVLVRPSSCTTTELSPPPTLSLKQVLNQSGLYVSGSGTFGHKLD